MYNQLFQQWLESDKLNQKDKEELLNIKDNDKEIEYRFGKELEFGTAGMRGIIALGTNVMNVYTVRRATQGLANYINSLGEKAKKRGVVISYDTRKFSFEFAYNAAVVLVSNGIKTYLFNDVRPVPMLSFAVRELKTISGIMITASHNPKEYNGYKVYGEDGAQMSPEATKTVVDYISKIESPLSDDILFNEKMAKKIILIGKKVDKKYYKAILKLSISKKEIKAVGKKIKLVYTPIHGSGYVPVTSILKKLKINATLVPEQINKDTEFSTVEVPNPEYKETLSLGIKLADFKNADVVFGTDPDCDRLGVVIRNNEGEFVALSGNETGILLLDYVLNCLKNKNLLDKKSFVVKSFVTTSMAKYIANDYGIELMEVPVGFKYIGEKIKQLDDTGKRKFLFGFEESCGYLRGTHCRDKDAVVASMLFAEMVCYWNYHNKSVYSRLLELYEKYGYVYDKTISITYSGLNAMRDMNQAVDAMKNQVISEIGEIPVIATRNYSNLTKTLADGSVENLDSSTCNALYFELMGGGFVCIRPSGTEPKLKTYYSICGSNKLQAEEIFNKVKSDFENIMNSK